MRSGEVYKKSTPPKRVLSNKMSISRYDNPLVRASARIPIFLRFATWSCIKAIKGEITRVIPSRAIPGT